MKMRQNFEEQPARIYMFEIPGQLSVLQRAVCSTQRKLQGTPNSPPGNMRSGLSQSSGGSSFWLPCLMVQIQLPLFLFAEKVQCNTEPRQTHPPCEVSHLKHHSLKLSLQILLLVSLSSTGQMHFEELKDPSILFLPTRCTT